MGGEQINLDNVGLAFGLVVMAGLSTGLGAAAVYNSKIVRLASKPVLAAGLGFSGGVMLYVSFVEIFVKSQGAFEASGKTEEDAYFSATLCLFAGMVILRLIALLVHKMDKTHDCQGCCADTLPQIRSNVMGMAELPPGLNQGEGLSPACDDGDADATARQTAEEGDKSAPADPAQVTLDDETPKTAQKDKKLEAMGLNTATAIAIHNFPEGLATFVATLADPTVGATLAIAIAIHNIPEGLCVALPVYFATGSRHRGFLWALGSGISEPIGALIGYGIIKATGSDMDQNVYGILFGLVAGMMIMIVLLELMPTGYRYDPQDKYVTNSLVAGMLVMAASLCLFMA